MTAPDYRAELDAQWRMAQYRARFMSWQLGRPVRPPSSQDEHVWTSPMRYADTDEPVTVKK